MDLPVYSHPEASSPRQHYPLRPSKIIGVGRNYRAHAAELGNDVPSEPLLFLKAPTSLVSSGEPICRPLGYQRVDFEGELAVIIGKAGRGISQATALDHVLGFSCANDVTIRDLQKRDRQWTRAKGFDTACPLGPRIIEELDLSNLKLVTTVDGEVRQAASTADMVFGVEEVIAYASELMTLLEGDVILTGTPAGVGNLEPGNRVTISITGIGELENTVVGWP
jgi:2-keto-4-pentenoate hydratase/2-oxohepta-3-ene-1,7-dioic acid hydratase in catechol pathway